jgi:hypothetical protein
LPPAANEIKLVGLTPETVAVNVICAFRPPLVVDACSIVVLANIAGALGAGLFRLRSDVKPKLVFVSMSSAVLGQRDTSLFKRARIKELG